MPTDFLLTYGVMAVLFVRQVAVFRQPNKINYAPLLLGVGGIGTLVHLMLHPEADDVVLLLRESMLPLFVGLILFIVTNVLHQARQRLHMQGQQEFTQKLIDQVGALQEYIAKLEENQHLISAKEDLNRDRMGDIFETERRSLDAIEQNQKAFIGTFGSMFERQELLLDRLETFTHKEMPDLDNVIHRHIDMLRIAEQDHFNQLRQSLKGMIQPRNEEALEAVSKVLEEGLNRVEKQQRESAARIVAMASEEFGELVEAVSNRLKMLKSQSESFTLALSENENRLNDMRSQSELMMKQMLLSVKNMNGVSESTERVRGLYEPLEALLKEVESVHSDYVKAKVRLENMAADMQEMDAQQIEKMRMQIEDLSRQLSERIDASLNTLHEHYHIAQKDITQTVKELSSRARFQQSYNPQ